MVPGSQKIGSEYLLISEQINTFLSRLFYRYVIILSMFNLHFLCTMNTYGVCILSLVAHPASDIESVGFPKMTFWVTPM